MKGGVSEMKKKNIRFCSIVFFLFLCAWSYPVLAIDITEPQTIVNPGYYELKNDIINSTTGISIIASDVILNGNNYTLDGQGSGSIGIYVHNNANTITNVTVKNFNIKNWTEGILFSNVQISSIKDNNLTQNYYGINLYQSNNLTVNNNNFSNNYDFAIYAYLSHDNVLTDNIAKYNGVGIFLLNVINNSVIKNNISDNSEFGLQIFGINNSIFHENLINNNFYGISLGASDKNIITNNLVNNNTNYGINLDSANNLVYNNYFNNSMNAIGGGTNNWNTTKRLGRNIVGNPYIGGNVYAKPDGTGLSQTQNDENDDGISIFGYSIDSNNIDYLPLLLPKGRPVAHFITNTTSGSAPLTVAFNDTSPNLPTTWNWSFSNVTGNNTQVWFSTAQNPAHTFGVGNYSIVLNASNIVGYNLSNQVTFINVTEPALPLVASFTGIPTTGDVPLTVQFNDTSTGFPSVWNWSFGDGIWFNTTVASQKNATHTYSAAGPYTVNLTVSNNAGKDSELKENYIRAITVFPIVMDEIAIFRPSTGYWYFDYNLDGVVDKSFRYGGNTDRIIVGKWNGTWHLQDGIAIFRPSTGYWYFDNNLDGIVDKSFRYGGSTDQIIKGRWQGTYEGIAIFRPSSGYWYFDYNLDGVVDKAFRYGGNSDQIIAGKWV